MYLYVLQRPDTGLCWYEPVVVDSDSDSEAPNVNVPLRLSTDKVTTCHAYDGTKWVESHVSSGRYTFLYYPFAIS